MAIIRCRSCDPNTAANKQAKLADRARTVAKAKPLPLATLDQFGAFGRPIVVPALVVGAGP